MKRTFVEHLEYAKNIDGAVGKLREHLWNIWNRQRTFIEQFENEENI